MEKNIIQFLCAKAAQCVESAKLSGKLSEIRIRVGLPLIIKSCGKDFVAGYSPTAEDIRETMEKISRYSYYAFESELAMGFITLPGGHRVGVCGQAVTEGGKVKAWRHIGSLNIRIAASTEGCADAVLPYITCGGGIYHTMIISPPGFGKTTLLRDIVRQISNGGLTVGLADERSEIAGCFKGVAQNDVGIRTDVIDSCPKAAAMIMLLRAMSPDVIAVDELGGEKDARAVEAVLNAGVKLLCTAHGNNFNDVRQNYPLAFERFVVLEGIGKIGGIFDGGGRRVD